MVTNQVINWADPKCQISDHFTVHDACWLHQWDKLYAPLEMEKGMLLKMAAKMEVVRAFLGNKPISVNCWMRPGPYNKLVGGAPSSYHLLGGAVDFTVAGMSCDEVRARLVAELDTFGLRMEKLPGSCWVHLDCKAVPEGMPRFFIP